MISASLITVFVSSSDGASIHPMIPSGAPAFTAASRTTLAAAIVDAFAAGCGLMMIAFLVFKQINVLKIAVDVGSSVPRLGEIAVHLYAKVLEYEIADFSLSSSAFSSLCFSHSFLHWLNVV